MSQEEDDGWTALCRLVLLANDQAGNLGKQAFQGFEYFVSMLEQADRGFDENLAALNKQRERVERAIQLIEAGRYRVGYPGGSRPQGTVEDSFVMVQSENFYQAMDILKGADHVTPGERAERLARLEEISE